jgi:hypothetical protein
MSTERSRSAGLNVSQSRQDVSFVWTGLLLSWLSEDRVSTLAAIQFLRTIEPR